MPRSQSLSFPIHALPAHERNVDLGKVLAALSFQPLKFAPGKFVTASAGGAVGTPQHTLMRVYEVTDVGVVALVEIDHATSGGFSTEAKSGTLIEVGGQSVRIIAEIDAADAGRACAVWELQGRHCQLYLWREPTTQGELERLLPALLRELLVK